MKSKPLITGCSILVVGLLLLLTMFPIHVAHQQNNTSFDMITIKDAQVAVEQFLILKEKQDEFSIQTGESIIHECMKRQIGFVFHLAPTGYVVISSSPRIHPIIAYSFSSKYHQNHPSNPLYSLICDDISSQLDYVESHPEYVSQEYPISWDLLISNAPLSEPYDDFQQWPPEGSTLTEGWIETRWHQGTPYNTFCPVDVNNERLRSIAGCPAIAMGQILYYHQTINQVQFTNADDYQHNYGSFFTIDDDHLAYDFPSFPVLNEHLMSVEQHFSDNIELTDDDLAALVFACGVAAEQVYSSQISGTFGVDQAYDAYQRFSCDTASLYYGPNTGILESVMENVKQALPVHFAVVTPTPNAGHNLIIDGYNTDGYFHLNFGWGGQSDGWYFIPNNMPYDLTVIEGVIIDILKKDTSEDLLVNGSIVWQDKNASDRVEGNFTIENSGQSNSLLTWEIVSTPSWGNWTIEPSEGHSLRPADGKITIHVTCELPDERAKQYSDSITVMNTNNPSDREYVPITLSLPKEKQPVIWFLDLIRQWFPFLQFLTHLIS